MIYLFHGDDNFKSRQLFYAWLKKYQRLTKLDGKEITLENLTTFNQDLFSQTNKKAIVLQELFSLPLKKLKEVCSRLIKIESDSDILIWEKKTITPAKIRLLGRNVKAFASKIPSVIFDFLDSVGKQPKSFSLERLDKTFKTHPPELILYLLEKRGKEMLLVKVNPNLLKTAPWLKNKILNQVRQLDLEQIKRIYLKLIEIDYKNKTGQLGNKLTEELIFFANDL